MSCRLVHASIYNKMTLFFFLRPRTVHMSSHQLVVPHSEVYDVHTCMSFLFSPLAPAELRAKCMLPSMNTSLPTTQMAPNGRQWDVKQAVSQATCDSFGNTQGMIFHPDIIRMLLPLGRYIVRGLQTRRYMCSLVLVGDDVCELEHNCCKSESTAKTMKSQDFHYRDGEGVVGALLLLHILSCFRVIT